MKYEYTLLTNLPLNTHDDEKIKNIYKQRWDVEVFFKLLKYNFKFEHTIEHDNLYSDTANIKLNLINLIIIYLSKIIEKVYYYDNNIVSQITKTSFVNGKNVNVIYKNKPNKSLIINGIYKILKDIFNNNLTIENLESILNNYADSRSASTEKRARIDLQDLKDLREGEYHIFFKSKILKILKSLNS